MRVSMIVAVADNGVIGRGGGLPWRLPDDMREFRRRTLDKPVVMGRKTWESLPGGPLARRLNLVVTRQAGYEAEGATVVGSVEEALEVARRSGAEEACVIGGASIYRAALPFADQLVITHVAASVEGDTHLPDLDLGAWKAVSVEAHAADERHEHPFRIAVYERAS